MRPSPRRLFTDPQLARAMQAAVAAARPFEGATAPNPPVGCVILDRAGNVLVAAGHQGAGQFHAEAAAISALKEKGDLQQAHTLVVTLEPCTHHGKTPPCTDAILATPVEHVVIGVSDPNPKVQGGGAERLKQAGLLVDFVQDEKKQVARLIAPFAKRVTRNLPFVTVKQAINAAGSMIPPVGQKTFTSEGSLLLAHALRRRADVILTGSGTILADNPEFTVRHLPDHANKRRGLYILDRRGRVPHDYVNEAIARGFDVTIVQDFETALRLIAEAGGNEVLVEAGPAVTAHVLATPHWDEHVRISQRGAEDHVEILTQGGADVFRHH